MHDPKGYSANITHLERALTNIDVVEYGRFKFTYSQFATYVTPKIEAAMQNNESDKYREFGHKL